MRYTVLILFFFASMTSMRANQDSLDQVLFDHGKELFKVNCKACHALDQKLVGPALKGVTERRDSSWIYAFVQGSQKMIADKEPTAVSLFNEFNQVIMPDQKVSIDEINAILNYVDIATRPKVGGLEYIERPVEVKEALLPLNFKYYAFWIPYTLGVALLVGLLYYMAEYFSLREERWEE